MTNSDDEAYELFGIRLDKRKKKKKTNVLDNLYTAPKKDKGLNAPHFAPVAEGNTHQADLLYLPNDDGNKYLLVVVDVGSRKVDAEPLKAKGSEDVLKAFKNIYDRKIISIPKRLEVDSGSEFKGAVKKYFNEMNVKIRYGKTGRHRQQAIVERMNYTIAKALFRRMSAQELLTGEESKEWVSDLPLLIKTLNKKAKNRQQRKLPDKPVCEGQECNMFFIGDKVRAIAEEPKDYVTGQKLQGKFRATDLRFDPRIRTIKEILLKPGFPPMYLLDGKVKGRDPVAYTKNQLKPVEKDEKYPDGEKVIRGQPSKYLVDKIIGKKKIKNRWYYSVQWKGYKDPTDEPARTIKKEVPELVKEFENSLIQ